MPKLPPLIEHTADDKKLLEIVVSYYHETLKQSPEAQQYLVKRGLQSAEMVEQFRLGFANRTLGYRLPDKNRVAGAEQRGRLQKLGIYRESGHEHFVGSRGDSDPQSERPGGADVRAQDQRPICAPEPTITCTCRGRIAECGTSRRCGRRKKSSCAKR